METTLVGHVSHHMYESSPHNPTLQYVYPQVNQRLKATAPTSVASPATSEMDRLDATPLKGIGEIPGTVLPTAGDSVEAAPARPCVVGVGYCGYEATPAAGAAAGLGAAAAAGAAAPGTGADPPGTGEEPTGTGPGLPGAGADPLEAGA